MESKSTSKDIRTYQDGRLTLIVENKYSGNISMKEAFAKLIARRIADRTAKS